MLPFPDLQPNADLTQRQEPVSIFPNKERWAGLLATVIHIEVAELFVLDRTGMEVRWLNLCMLFQR